MRNIRVLSRLIVLCIIMYTLNSFSATESESYLDIKAGTSEFNRSDKSISLLVQPIGFGAIAEIGLSSGSSIAFFMNRNNQLTFDYSTEVKGSSETWFGGGRSEKATAYSVHYKSFIGNTFYIKTGLEHRNYSFNYNSKCVFFCSSSDDINGGLDGTSENFNFVIGNQWQFSGFTFGCDWIGVSAPLTHVVSSKYVEGNPKASVDSELDKKIKMNLIDPGLLALRFYLGASF